MDSRLLLLGLLGCGRRTVLYPEQLCPCDPLQNLLLTPDVLGVGVALLLLNTTHETDKVIEVVGIKLCEQGTSLLNLMYARSASAYSLGATGF